MSRRNKHRHDNGRSDYSDDKDDDDGEYKDGGNNTRGGIGRRMTYCGHDAMS
jgi:hypothetical protein